MFKTDRDNKTLQGCNDCIFDYDGNLWVTAPAGNIAPAAFSRSWDVSKELSCNHCNNRAQNTIHYIDLSDV